MNFKIICTMLYNIQSCIKCHECHPQGSAKNSLKVIIPQTIMFQLSIYEFHSGFRFEENRKKECAVQVPFKP